MGKFANEAVYRQLSQCEPDPEPSEYGAEVDWAEYVAAELDNEQREGMTC